MRPCCNPNIERWRQDATSALPHEARLIDAIASLVDDAASPDAMLTDCSWTFGDDEIAARMDERKSDT